MKHAGVAITVTSITDVFAFGIGAVTVSKYGNMGFKFPKEKFLQHFLSGPFTLMLIEGESQNLPLGYISL